MARTEQSSRTPESSRRREQVTATHLIDDALFLVHDKAGEVRYEGQWGHGRFLKFGAGEVTLIKNLLAQVATLPKESNIPTDAFITARKSDDPADKRRVRFTVKTRGTWLSVTDGTKSEKRRMEIATNDVRRTSHLVEELGKVLEHPEGEADHLCGRYYELDGD